MLMWGGGDRAWWVIESVCVSIFAILLHIVLCHKCPEGTRQGLLMPAAFSQVDRNRQYLSVRMLEITSQCRPLLWPLINKFSSTHTE